MELSATLNSQEQSMVRMQVDSFNKVIEQGNKTSQNLGKDDFIPEIKDVLGVATFLELSHGGETLFI